MDDRCGSRNCVREGGGGKPDCADITQRSCGGGKNLGLKFGGLGWAPPPPHHFRTWDVKAAASAMGLTNLMCELDTKRKRKMTRLSRIIVCRALMNLCSPNTHYVYTTLHGTIGYTGMCVHGESGQWLMRQWHTCNIPVTYCGHNALIPLHTHCILHVGLSLSISQSVCLSISLSVRTQICSSNVMNVTSASVTQLKFMEWIYWIVLECWRGVLFYWLQKKDDHEDEVNRFQV